MTATHPPTGRLVYLAAFLAALGGLLFGYDTGVISGALLFFQREFSLGAAGKGVVVSSVLWGAVAGAALGGPCADRWGRKRAIFGAAALFAAGAVITAAAPSIAVLVAGRVIVGVGIGFASLLVPMYIAEIAPPRLRGSLVTLNQLAITVGIVTSYLVDYLLAPRQAWRWMFGLALVPAAVLGAAMVFLPDSPRWLAHRGELERAKDVLAKVRGSREAAEAELADIRRSLAAQQAGWRELLAPWLRPALLIALLLALFQQVTGINTIIYYAPTIFQQAGLRSETGAILATLGIGVVNVLFTIVATALLDRAGRRPLLLVGIAGMALALVGLIATFLALPPGERGWPAGICIAAYVAAFAIGLGPVFWLLLPEVFPLKVRGAGMSAGTLCNWASNLIVTLTFPILLEGAGPPATFGLFAALSAVAWLFVLLRVPETKGKSLEEIEEQWRTRAGGPLAGEARESLGGGMRPAPRR